MNPGTPPAEVTFDTTQVRALLTQQHPDLAHLPIRMLDAGFDNLMFRLGNSYCLRFPRRSAAAVLVLREQEWLPFLAQRYAGEALRLAYFLKALRHRGSDHVPAPTRQHALERYAPDAHLLARAHGWAVSFGSLLLDTGRVDHPQHAQIGAATLRRLSQDVAF
jgi:hypothetical protein